MILYYTLSNKLGDNMQQNIYQKIMQLRESAVALDWKPDKSYVFKGSRIEYVTISKMRKNFAPLFTASGLEFDFNIISVEDHEDFVRIEVEFILVDSDSGEYVSSTLFADGSSVFEKGGHNDKAIEIALSYAARMYFTNKFQIVDGIELDTEGEQAESDFNESLNKVTIEEDPVVVKPKVAKVVITKKQSEEPTENPSKTDDKSGEVVAPVKTEEKANLGVSALERSAAEKTMTLIEKAYQDGKIVEDVFNKAASIYAHIETSKDVMELLEIGREVKSMKGDKQ